MNHLLNKTIIDYHTDDNNDKIIFCCKDANYIYSVKKDRIFDIDVFNKFPIIIRKIEFSKYCDSWCFYEDYNETDPENAQIWISIDDYHGKSKEEPLILVGVTMY